MDINAFPLPNKLDDNKAQENIEFVNKLEEHGDGYHHNLSSCLSEISAVGAWEEQCEKDKEFMEKLVSGKDVLDLGCGDIWTRFRAGLSPLPPMVGVAEKLNARPYTGVDFWMLRGSGDCDPVGDIVLERKDILDEAGITLPDNMICSLRHEDAIRFLAYLELNIKPEDRPSVIVLNAIDMDIIYNEEYHKRLAEGIFRALPEGGVVLTAASTAEFHFEEAGLTLIRRYGEGNSRIDSGGVSVWMKPETSTQESSE